MDRSYYEFYRDVGKLYPEEEITYRTLRGIVRRKFILRYLASLRGSLLDIGCNRGHYIAEYTGGPAAGADISTDVLKFAAGRGRKGDNPLGFVAADAEELCCFRECSFDHVLCSEMLEHVYRPERVIAGIERILKPGGTAMITTPNYRKEKPSYIRSVCLEAYGVRGMKDGEYYHTAFKPDEIADMFGQAGMTVIEKGTFEKEVIYASRIPAVAAYAVLYLNRFTLRSRKIDLRNEKMLDSFSRAVYRACLFLKLDPMLQSCVGQGVRTFVIARKDSDNV